MHILLVEDDEKIGRYLVQGLKQAGNTAERAETAEEGLRRIGTLSFDAVIVDLMLPGMSGEELLATLRDQGSDVPVLILSAKSSVDERIAGLRLGADDYVCKPFSFTEVNERLLAITRRTRPTSDSELQCGNITLTERGLDGRIGVEPIRLRAKELQLLRLLIRNRNRIVPKSIILERIWNMDFDPESNIVDVLVYRLRKQLEEYGATARITTVRGLGYMLTDE